MKIFTQISLSLCFIFLCSFQASGADRYISDILVITLRDAPSKSSNIIGHLRSGDYMTILEENESGYIRVQVSSGIEGWIPKKYTAVGKSKDSLIRRFKKNIVTLEDENNNLLNKVNVLTEQVNDYQSTIDNGATNEAKQQAHIVNLEKQVVDAQNKYITLKDQSEGVEAIYTEQEKLIQDNDMLTDELAVLKVENNKLDQAKNIFWFLAGAGVLLIGCIIGRSGRKSRRNSLTL